MLICCRPSHLVGGRSEGGSGALVCAWIEQRSVRVRVSLRLASFVAA